MCGQAAVVGLEERLEDEAGEELGLGELPGAVLVGVPGQGLGADGHGLAGDAQRRFAQFAHTS